METERHRPRVPSRATLLARLRPRPRDGRLPLAPPRRRRGSRRTLAFSRASSGTWASRFGNVLASVGTVRAPGATPPQHGSAAMGLQRCPCRCRCRCCCRCGCRCHCRECAAAAAATGAAAEITAPADRDPTAAAAAGALPPVPTPSPVSTLPPIPAQAGSAASSNSAAHPDFAAAPHPSDSRRHADGAVH